MYLVLIRKITTVDNKEFTLYTKRKIHRYAVSEYYSDGKPRKYDLYFDGGNVFECRIMNDNTKIMGLHEIPNTWYDDTETPVLPYKGRIYRDMTYSGMSKEVKNHFSKKENRYVGVGRLIPYQGNNHFVLDNGEIVKMAINNYYYEPF